MNYEIKWGQNDTVYRDAAALRTEVFVDEQKFEEEFDQTDAVALHMVVYEENATPIATGRLFEEAEGTWHIGRICALKRLRGTGLGRVIVQELEKKAATLGATRIILGAQTRVQGFYETLGYRVYGEEYYEEYCAHVPMEKLL